VFYFFFKQRAIVLGFGAIGVYFTESTGGAQLIERKNPPSDSQKPDYLTLLEG